MFIILQKYYDSRYNKGYRKSIIGYSESEQECMDWIHARLGNKECISEMRYNDDPLCPQRFYMVFEMYKVIKLEHI